MNATLQQTTKRPTDEAIQIELAVALSLKEKYQTNNPHGSYEDGIIAALLWVLGGEALPQ